MLKTQIDPLEAYKKIWIIITSCVKINLEETKMTVQLLRRQTNLWLNNLIKAIHNSVQENQQEELITIIHIANLMIRLNLQRELTLMMLRIIITNSKDKLRKNYDLPEIKEKFLQQFLWHQMFQIEAKLRHNSKTSDNSHKFSSKVYHMTLLNTRMDNLPSITNHIPIINNILE